MCLPIICRIFPLITATADYLLIRKLMLILILPLLLNLPRYYPLEGILYYPQK